MKFIQSENSTNALVDSQCPYSADYRQALSDFGVLDLLEALRQCCSFDRAPVWMDWQEGAIENLTAQLIEHIRIGLNKDEIAGHLSSLMSAQEQSIDELLLFKLTSSQSHQTLPEFFPHQVEKPLFQYGNAVRWMPLSDYPDPDRGIVIGYFFAYASHRRQWTWKYLIWLEKAVGSVQMDTAWEEDLKEVT